jgi:hypothetical protein
VLVVVVVVGLDWRFGGGRLVCSLVLAFLRLLRLGGWERLCGWGWGALLLLLVVVEFEGLYLVEGWFG